LTEFPYNAPQANLSGTKEQSRPRYRIPFFISAILASVLSIGLGYIGTFVIPSFMQVSDAFEVDLSAVTLAVFHLRLWLWSAFAIVVLLWFFAWHSWSRHDHSQMRITVPFIVLCAIDIGMYAWLTEVLYEPILMLGKAHT
jgi:type II secretory pathway component PulF